MQVTFTSLPESQRLVSTPAYPGPQHPFPLSSWLLPGAPEDVHRGTAPAGNQFKGRGCHCPAEVLPQIPWIWWTQAIWALRAGCLGGPALRWKY